jgi:predicted GNAT superfamily acetyltransferase
VSTATIEAGDRGGALKSPVTVRDLTPADHEVLLVLNNRHAAEVNALTPDAFSGLVALAARARVVEGGLGFLIALDETTPHHGPNHGWFLAREAAFLYIDRVVVAPEARGRGLGRRLYEDLAATAEGRPLCCEVNIDPPNPGSLAFHERLGFEPLGEATDPRNGKIVRYLRCPASSARSRLTRSRD